MFAKKANKIYRIDEAQKTGYLKEGYDICDEKGEVVEHSPLATVKYADYEKLLKEKDILQKENSRMAAELSAAKKKQSAKASAGKEKAEDVPGQEDGSEADGADGSV